MPRIYITITEDNAVVVQTLVKSYLHKFTHLPIVVTDIPDEFVAGYASLLGDRFHPSEYGSYLPILEALDKWASTSEPGIVNISLSPNPYPFNPDEPVNVATRVVANMGHAVVVAAGNAGPAEDTLNPWCMPPWVIAVGASDETGQKLLLKSSVGSASRGTGPCVVAQGRTVVPLNPLRDDGHGTMVALVMMGKEGGGRDLPGYVDEAFEGTSVSAPRVSRICLIILELLLTILGIPLLLKMRAGEHANLQQLADTTEKLLQRERIDAKGITRLHHRKTSEIANILKTYLRIHEFGLSGTEMPMPTDGRTPFPTHVLRKMLEQMARPMPEYMQHEVGVGFVNEHIATEYLLKFTGRQFLHLFYSGAADQIIYKWPLADERFIDANLLGAVKEGLQPTLTSLRVI